MWRASVTTLCLAAPLLVNGDARADEPAPVASLAFALPPLRPIGSPILSPGHGARRAHAGVLVGVDAGWTTLLGGDGQDATGGGSFGARLGYQFRNGLALQSRYDFLGVSAPALSASPGGAIQVASAGLRYSLYTGIVAPFGEAMIGSAFFGGDATIAGSLALGATIPLTRHFGIDLAVRDWLLPIDGHARQAIVADGGIYVSFAGP